MCVHLRQLPSCHHTCFLCRRSRAKGEQSCCSFQTITSMDGSGTPRRDGTLLRSLTCFLVQCFENLDPAPFYRREKSGLELRLSPAWATSPTMICWAPQAARSPLVKHLVRDGSPHAVQAIQ